ncbi:amidase [Muricoccus pecuniae]|uniref:Aspartyl-tRNA(Asn)/glutamyl-tRNA(Gln) amidotransferase subunit A n=1 Tax=Muricoccus pecuniae TaxID=693023 RepID=A0A840Y7T4_9PROT|nr:amidase [Roseomonas pecuniae]MBB5692427.1 aspartyl-tRNA(Asn)/glutamyl-tRNA(Gln) amidotransferase subunit A [Roseomonas pecuniae]
MMTIEDAARALAAGETGSEQLVEEALSRIADPGGEGSRAFVAVQTEEARAAARAMDLLRGAGRAPSPYAGIPISIKDLFDQAGVVTAAGSLARRNETPATATAPAIARLERAGFVVLGRTNMVEFAFSGTGLNPHHGTPRAPYDRSTGRVPGGSSSGAAVAVADGMGFGAIGSDTGGSCRVPAALCGITGFKPTARRVPTAGAFPLSTTLDSIGPLAPSAACCAVLDAVMAGEEGAAPPSPMPLEGLRLGLPSATYLFDGLAPAVIAAFDIALRRLEAAGAKLIDVALPELAEIPAANATGGFAASEAWALHRELIGRSRELYDPMILARIERGSSMTAAELIALMSERARIIAAIAPRTAPFDAIVAPTCPLTPPSIAELEAVEDFNRVNLLLLRNTAVGNFLDRCSISLPCHAEGEAPVGLMLTGEHGGDRRLLAVARAVEGALRAG